jgi:hypothetical protein
MMELKLLSFSEKQIIARDGDHEMTFKRYRSKNSEENTQCKNADTKMAEQGVDGKPPQSSQSSP